LAYQGNGSSAAAKVAEYDLPENFAFSDFISVNVNVDNLETPTARVTILSANQRFIQEDVPFVGCRGQVFAQPASAMTNAVLSYSMRDLKQDVFIFGDSYISLNDQNRCPYHVIQAGYTDYLLCGFPGAGSQDILAALQQMISLARPKYIVWLLGMNNPDTETGYNENWKTALDSVLEICENIKATPILATIPNTPTVSNYYKNQYVRESGHRYIDFAKAVGAEALNAPWYTGMLSTDNVHPTVYGARALAMRLLADLPEIT
jgi:lysophospholipase L1-like esterase